MLMGGVVIIQVMYVHLKQNGNRIGWSEFIEVENLDKYELCPWDASGTKYQLKGWPETHPKYSKK